MLDAASEGRLQRCAARRTSSPWWRPMTCAGPCPIGTAPEVVEEDGTWSVLFPGSPLAAEGGSFQEAVDDTITVLREYAEDWVDHLRNAAKPLGQLGFVSSSSCRRTTNSGPGSTGTPSSEVAGAYACRSRPVLPERRLDGGAQRHGQEERPSPHVRTRPGGRHGPPHSYFSAAGPLSYGASMWAHIWRDQLAVGEAAFWACVNEELPLTAVAPENGGDIL